MKILIATDSFKDALSALEVCQAIEAGIKLADPTIETTLFPMADGGEGTSEILRFHNHGQEFSLEVSDPLFRKTRARYSLSGDQQTAFMEMAQASGLQLLKPSERNCLKTSSYGTGEMIRHALDLGVGKIVLGIGGSATNDAGMGMAAALGFRFLDEKGKLLEPIGENLIKVRHIESAKAYQYLEALKVEVVCDVDNPLFGPQGAAFVYAPQKGADAKAVQLLDEGLQNFSEIIGRNMGMDVSKVPGAGAAGGMGAGAMIFLGAELRKGIELVMDLTNFEQAVQQVDLIITGEGKLDAQTLHGKLIHGMAAVAGKYQIPIIAFCGALEANPNQLKSLGIQAAFSILHQVGTLDAAIANTAENLRSTAYNLIRAINGFR